MDIKLIRFEAFKSLYDVTCDLDHLTVITGPNGAGKSNLVDALNFLGEVYAHGLEFAVSRAGGFDNIAHRRSRRAKRSIAVTLELELTSNDIADAPQPFLAPDRNVPLINLTYLHSFSIKTASQSVLADYEVESDVIQLLDEKRNVVFSYTHDVDGAKAEVTKARTARGKRIRDVVYPYGDSRYEEFLNQRKPGKTSLLSEQLVYANLLTHVKRAISRIRVFQLSPYQVRSAGVPTPNATLERHGENLPGAADHIRRNDPNAWKSIQQAMRAILPDLVDIQIAYTEDRRLALQFREQNVGRPWSTGEVSDGTIQALALFVALFDRRNPMLAIEEPENSVHPWILRQFIDLCGTLPDKQIVLTTHSPVLLNYVQPGTIRLMSMAMGRSQIRRLLSLSPEIAELTLSGELTVFDAYDSGILPQAVPRGLSPEYDGYDADGAS